MREITLRELQRYIAEKDNREGQDYAYFLKLVEEVGELAEAIHAQRRLEGLPIRDRRSTIEEESYDVLYYLLVLCNRCGIDLTDCAHLKERFNQERFGVNNDQNGAWGSGASIHNIFAGEEDA